MKAPDVLVRRTVEIERDLYVTATAFQKDGFVRTAHLLREAADCISKLRNRQKMLNAIKDTHTEEEGS